MSRLTGETYFRADWFCKCNHDRIDDRLERPQDGGWSLSFEIAAVRGYKQERSWTSKDEEYCLRDNDDSVWDLADDTTEDPESLSGFRSCTKAESGGREARQVQDQPGVR